MTGIVELDPFNVVAVSADGDNVAIAWGPAADSTGNWFVRVGGEDGYRVAGKAAAWIELEKALAVDQAVAR